MAIEFPSFPYHKDEYIVPETGAVYQYDQSTDSWNFQLEGSQVIVNNSFRITLSDTAPQPAFSAEGDLWVNTDGYFLHVFNGQAWIALTNSTGDMTKAHVGPTPPVGALSEGALWYDSNVGDMRIWYVDDDSSQWVSATGNAINATNSDGARISNVEAILQTMSVRLASIEQNSESPTGIILE